MTRGESKSRKISRREFVKGTAVGAGTLAGAGALASCAPAAAPAAGVPDKWDKEAGVVVVGSGTGLAGALAASVAGATVIVLEKLPTTGGSTGMSGGGVWIPNNSVMKAEGIEDSRENALTYLRLIAQGQADEEVIAAFADKGPEMIDFVAANSPIVWELFDLVGLTMWEYHPEWPGAVPYGRSLMPKAEDAPFFRGGPLIQGLLDGCEENGVEVLLETPAKRLVTRMLPDGTQEVLGVEAESGGRVLNIKANKGVILAAGGYAWNPEMQIHFLRGPARYTLASPGNTGDGILMAMAVGADLRNMNECWGSQFYKEPSEAVYSQGVPGTSSQRGKPGSIMVNRYGERFCNEAADYDSFWRSFLTWENWGELGYRNIPAYLIMDDACQKAYGVTGIPEDAAQYDWVKQGGSLKELAQALGIDPEGLEKAVAEFNEHASEGEDPQFHRGESLYDRQGLYCDPSIEGCAATLAPLETPPFYGAEVASGTIGTCGGARVNANAQVLAPFGQVIPRLYCAGNNSGVGGPGASYGGGGGTIGPGMAFAYIAGQHVVTLDPWA
jgi:3-oxosteroid 1-dehydrogenase